MAKQKTLGRFRAEKERAETQLAQGQRKFQHLCNLGGTVESIASEGANNDSCPTVRKQIGKAMVFCKGM